MEVFINGNLLPLDDNPGIADMLVSVNIRTDAGIALAVNDTVVPKSQWSDYRLQHGDKITIIKATQGG